MDEQADFRDQELLNLYRKEGRIELLSQLYSPYMPLVYGVCLKYLRDREESKDAVMQIFEKLITAMRTHQVDRFRSWLYVTARNYCLMKIRSEKGRFMEDISASVMEKEVILHPSEDPDPDFRLAGLDRCLEELVEEQRKCVKLFYLQERCYREISDLTGFDQKKVKSYIQNGKRNLKICLQRNG